MIQQRYHGDRLRAEEDCRLKFISKTKTTITLNGAENQVLTEVSLWAEAMQQTDPEKLSILSAMINAKPYDVFAYQELLIRFLKIKLPLAENKEYFLRFTIAGLLRYYGRKTHPEEKIKNAECPLRKYG